MRGLLGSQTPRELTYRSAEEPAKLSRNMNLVSPHGARDLLQCYRSKRMLLYVIANSEQPSWRLPTARYRAVSPAESSDDLEHQTFAGKPRIPVISSHFLEQTLAQLMEDRSDNVRGSGQRRLAVGQILDPVGLRPESDLSGARRTEHLGVQDPGRQKRNMSPHVAPLGSLYAFRERSPHQNAQRLDIVRVRRHRCPRRIVAAAQFVVGKHARLSGCQYNRSCRR